MIGVFLQSRPRLDPMLRASAGRTLSHMTRERTLDVFHYPYAYAAHSPPKARSRTGCRRL